MGFSEPLEVLPLAMSLLAAALSRCSGVPMEDSPQPRQHHDAWGHQLAWCQNRDYKGLGLWSISRPPGAQGQCPVTDQRQGAVGAKLFLDELQGQAVSLAGGAVGVHFPGQSSGALTKG